MASSETMICLGLRYPKLYETLCWYFQTEVIGISAVKPKVK